jgi:hypothetical protein
LAITVFTALYAQTQSKKIIIAVAASFGSKTGAVIETNFRFSAPSALKT